MKPLFRKIVCASIAAGLSLMAGVSASAQDDSVGIVRITQTKVSAPVDQQVTPASFRHGQRQVVDSTNCDCQPQHQGRFGHHQGQCPINGNGSSMGGGCPQCQGRYLTIEDMFCSALGRNRDCNHAEMQQAKCDYLRCKFGYFVPSGAGGAGIPCCGKYSRVYPQDPHYFDQRDGQAWAAQGYGSPIAVPLAPVVGHTFNYGWGIPSSRLTPISHPAY